jgi:hypothetical protein
VHVVVGRRERLGVSFLAPKVNKSKSLLAVRLGTSYAASLAS